ncbi:MAG TPA: hypothetical protein PL196_05250, partial [Burkholderiaceae bacterium]|nr:hypothetical protein [Burkholderiaceae bacterium]
MSVTSKTAQRRATRGAVAKAVVGAEAIETKATVRDRHIGAALKHFGMTEDNDEERHIYFFDTAKLDLLAANVIARARRVIGEEHDSTVKFRPVDPAKVDMKWQRFPDFKIEVDASEKGMVKSASFSMPVKKGPIKRVASGDVAIEALFTPEQEEFLQSMATRKVDYRRLVVLGPLHAHRWRHEDPACPWPITAELWRREDGARLMELSIKAPAVQAAAAIGGFRAYLAELGAERDSDEQAKTRWALDYYASRRPTAPPARAAPPKQTGTKRPAATKPAAPRGVAKPRAANQPAPAPAKATRKATPPTR